MVQIPNHDNIKKIGYYLDEYDYKKLKLFFIFLLWRASVSTRDSFSSVDLGRWKSKARQHILEENPGNKDEFSVLLARFNGTENELEKAILFPFKERWDGVNAYRFYLGGVSCVYLSFRTRNNELKTLKTALF